MLQVLRVTSFFSLTFESLITQVCIFFLTDLYDDFYAFELPAGIRLELCMQFPSLYP